MAFQKPSLNADPAPPQRAWNLKLPGGREQWQWHLAKVNDFRSSLTFNHQNVSWLINVDLNFRGFLEISFFAYFFRSFFPPSTKEELTPVLATPPPATRNSSGSLASPNVGPPKPPRPPGGYPSAGARCSSFAAGARCAYIIHLGVTQKWRVKVTTSKLGLECLDLLLKMIAGILNYGKSFLWGWFCLTLFRYLDQI